VEETFDYDLDALVVEEENAPPFRFQWRGEIFEMPLMMGMDFKDQLALEAATVEESMRLIMGGDYDRLVQEPISIGRMKALIEAWHRHQGVEPGELVASSRSSVNTARRSKPTSRSTRRR
jgi:hypothetical protein